MIQCFNCSMIAFLPLSCLNEFAELALHQIALENTEMTVVDLAVQVISLVEKSAGKQVFAGPLKPLSTHILSTHRNLAGTRDWFPKFGNAKAPFILCVLSFSVSDLGIHQDQLRLGILFESYIDDCQSLGNTDLRRRQTHSMGRIH